MCIDEHADAWACGVEARDQLTKLIGSRAVRCGDLGADPAFKNGASASAPLRVKPPV